MQLREVGRQLEALGPPAAAAGGKEGPGRGGARRGAGGGEIAKAAAPLASKVNALIGKEPDFPPVPEKEPGIKAIHAGLAALAVSVGTGDAAPTPQAAAAFAAYRAQLDRALAAWSELRAAGLPALNRRLAAGGMRQIEVPP
ncbi:MAG TPA: hypothetical protein VMW75_01405 [Thermoanaerobaculia bacterium]|nr:hypothetical protein [Thermoanaerobaculia bacterium]